MSAPELRLIRGHLDDDVAAAIADAQRRHPTGRSWGQTDREADIAEDLRGYDPACRYAAQPDRYPTHVCARNTGEPVRLGESCRYEAHAHMRETSSDWVCVTCGEQIPLVGGRGGVTTPSGRTYKFHSGDCFARADEAIAELEARQGGAQ